MFNETTFNRVYRFGRSNIGSAWWLVLGPGLLLSLMGLAILLWPELLAYMVAGALIFAGVSLSLWGWSLRLAQKQVQRSVVHYEMR
jgi:hypothetical protein